MEKKRCFWAENVPEIYVRYHDEEWGREVHDDHKLFEMLLLESFQAGLSWLTILKKREAFREAFDAFDVAKVAGYTEEKQKELMQNPGIIRNRLKIRAAVKNAVIFQQIQREYGSFSAYLWGFTEGKVIYRTQKELQPTPRFPMKSVQTCISVECGLSEALLSIPICRQSVL